MGELVARPTANCAASCRRPTRNTLRVVLTTRHKNERCRGCTVEKRRLRPISFFVRFLKSLLICVPLVAIANAEAGTKMSLVIGIDGLGFGTRGFGATPTPVLDSLIEGSWSPGYHGAYNPDAFVGGYVNTVSQQATFSGPGWSTILTGVWRDRHGVNDNGQTFIDGNFVENPNYLTTLKSADPTIWTGLYVWWYPTYRNIFVPLYLDDVEGNEPDFANYYQNSYQAYVDGGDELLAIDAVEGIASLSPDVPGAIFTAFDTVDHWGHVAGSSSQGYGDAIARTDSRVGELLQAVSNRPTFAEEDWQIIVTSDHGHKPLGGHGSHSPLERTVPLIVASQQVVQGRAGPPAGGIPVSHADVAPTVLDHFGVPIPTHYAGQSRAVGILPDFTADGEVDGSDLEIFEKNFGVSFRNAPLHSDGNSDADFDVDGADFVAWQRHAFVPAAAQVIPEPATTHLVLSFVWAWRSLYCRRINLRRRPAWIAG